MATKYPDLFLHFAKRSFGYEDAQAIDAAPEEARTVLLKAYQRHIEQENARLNPVEKTDALANAFSDTKNNKGAVGVEKDFFRWLEAKGTTKGDYDKLSAPAQNRLINTHTHELSQFDAQAKMLKQAAAPPTRFPPEIERLEESDPLKSKLKNDYLNAQAWREHQRNSSNG